MKLIAKTAVLAVAAVALAACGKTYESAAQRANEVGQPAGGLSSDPVVYDSTGAVVSPPPGYTATQSYPTYPYATRYSYPSSATYYDPYYPTYPNYPSGTPYYPYTSGYNYSSGYPVAATVSPMDQQFLRDAMAGTAAEIELARYVYDRASTSVVRDYARQMVDDHARMANQLNAVAVRKGVPPMAISGGVIPSDLAGRNGRDFDEAYMDHMVDQHDRALRLFQQEASAGSDPEIRSAAATAIPTIEMHLDMAQRVADQVD